MVGRRNAAAIQSSSGGTKARKIVRSIRPTAMGAALATVCSIVTARLEKSQLSRAKLSRALTEGNDDGDTQTITCCDNCWAI